MFGLEKMFGMEPSVNNGTVNQGGDPLSGLGHDVHKAAETLFKELGKGLGGISESAADLWGDILGAKPDLTPTQSPSQAHCPIYTPSQTSTEASRARTQGSNRSSAGPAVSVASSTASSIRINADGSLNDINGGGLHQDNHEINTHGRKTRLLQSIRDLRSNLNKDKSRDKYHDKVVFHEGKIKENLGQIECQGLAYQTKSGKVTVDNQVKVYGKINTSHQGKIRKYNDKLLKNEDEMNKKTMHLISVAEKLLGTKINLDNKANIEKLKELEKSIKQDLEKNHSDHSTLCAHFPRPIR